MLRMVQKVGGASVKVILQVLNIPGADRRFSFVNVPKPFVIISILDLS